MDATQKVYFSKVILSNAYFVGTRAVPFEPLNGNEGVIALDPKKDSELIQGLTDAANRGVGGIVKISAQEYEEKKTQAPLRPSAPRRQNDIRPFSPPASPFSQTTEQKKEPVVATAAEPAPVQPEAQQPATAAESGALSESEMQALTQAEQSAEPPAPAEPVFKPTTRKLSRKQTDPVPAD